MAEIPIRSYAVSVVVLRKRGAHHEVLLMQRATTLNGAWCQVAGGIEEGETAWQAALRELREETALTPTSLYSADTCEQFYEPDRDTLAIFPVFVAFVDATAEVVLNDEHKAFQWVSFDEARDIVSFGGQRRVLTWIEDEFIHRDPSEHLRIDLKS